MKKNIKYIINNQEVSEAKGKKILKGKAYTVQEIKENDNTIKFYIKYNW